ncbi:MAG: hypothetical protein K8T10_19655 [Candidatus Eremiobacteraeota bacterium]|nr:hypothetical protein [Candidatus Eremiobacteraeota bacterium]
MSADIARKKFEQLKSKIENGTVHSLVRRVGYGRVAEIGEEEGSSHLPTLSGQLNGFDLNFYFSPYPDGGHLLNIEARIICPFKLRLTLEKQETKSNKFKPVYQLPVSEIEVDVKEFDERYFIETIEEEPVRKFLAIQENRKMIDELEDFDSLSFQYKHLKLLYYLEKIDGLDIDQLFKRIKLMTKMGKVLHELEVPK